MHMHLFRHALPSPVGTSAAAARGQHVTRRATMVLPWSGPYSGSMSFAFCQTQFQPTNGTKQANLEVAFFVFCDFVLVVC